MFNKDLLNNKRCLIKGSRFNYSDFHLGSHQYYKKIQLVNRWPIYCHQSS